MDRHQQGLAAESTALAYLQAQGLQLICRNFRCRRGELDLVMLEGEILVIVEVRCRRDQGYGTAADSIGARKRARVVRAAQHLLAARPALRHLPARFDVVTLDGPAECGGIEWIRAAFTTDA